MQLLKMSSLPPHTSSNSKSSKLMTRHAALRAGWAINPIQVFKLAPWFRKFFNIRCPQYEPIRSRFLPFRELSFVRESRLIEYDSGQLFYAILVIILNDDISVMADRSD